MAESAKKRGKAMLYKAICLASQIYHRDDPFNYVRHYDSYLRTRTLDLRRGPEEISAAGVRQVIRFLGQWKTHYQSSEDGLARALCTTWEDLQMLQEQDILHLNLDSRSNAEVIEKAFQTIATCGPRYESTGTSKILHLLQPRLFVMWDAAIAQGYGFRPRWAYGSRGDEPASDYAHRFLARMQLLARRAVNEHLQYHGGTPAEAIRALCCCGHTLAMVLDEYNYVKFTMNHEEVWRTEFSS